MLLGEVVAVSARVASTSSRSAKVAALADLLRTVGPAELETAVAVLAGAPRQGKVGVGWATMMAIEPPPAQAATLTLSELDRAVDELQAVTGPGSAKARERVLGDLLARATTDEQFFIRSLLLGELRHGALEGVVADAVARAAGVPLASVRRAAMLAGDLHHIASVARSGGEAALAEVGLVVLRPIQPMLASGAAGVAEALAANGLSLVEWKLDGARIAGHRFGDEVRLFTRNLNDITARLPGVAASLRALPADRFILDGEVLGAGGDERPDRFQDTMSRFGRADGGGTALGVWWFDCLHLDGVDLLDRPLVERRAALEGLAGARCVPSMMTGDPSAAQAFLDGALAAGHEGVLVYLNSSGGHRHRGQRVGQCPIRALRVGSAYVGPSCTSTSWTCPVPLGRATRPGWVLGLRRGRRRLGSGSRSDARSSWTTTAAMTFG